MSDKRRRCTGIIMITASILLCLISVISSQTSKSVFIRTGDSPAWVMNEIPTQRSGSVRVNSDDVQELTALPGIGDTLAELIIAEREQNGPFYYAEDLEAVKGIGPGTLKKISSLIDLSLDESGDEDGISGTIP